MCPNACPVDQAHFRAGLRACSRAAVSLSRPLPKPIPVFGSSKPVSFPDPTRSTTDQVGSGNGTGDPERQGWVLEEV